MGRTTQHPIPNNPKTLVWRRLITALIVAISTGLLVILTDVQSFSMLANSPPSPHPLPPTLVQWQDQTHSGDYFDQIQPTKSGYLVWSQFPINVYVETPKEINSTQAIAWVQTVSQAVQEWSIYLPMQIVPQPEGADIKVVRSPPPLRTSARLFPLRARSAQTTYEFYVSNNLLLHRFTILLSPSQAGKYLHAAALHELGHALGIWGHSLVESDVMYFSQVRNPPSISARDVNTLKRVYEQPTSLGWGVAVKDSF